MPIVTVDPKEYERFELKTAPPDGFVSLRPLPYGMKLSRRSKATKMMMRQSGATSKGQAQGEQVFEVESMDEWAVAFDFAYCIGDHNLQNADGTLIEFDKNTHMKIRLLSPKVGTEIEQLIDNLNNAEDEESVEDFLRRSDTSSSATSPSLETDGKESLTGGNLQSV